MSARTALAIQWTSILILHLSGYTAFPKTSNECDIAFFLSTQITRLPDGLADLAVNISSLHEMRPEQIAFYFSQFDRLLKVGGQFYFKEWKRGALPFENLIISQEDYPVPVSWNCELSRDAPIQTRFFEARCRKSGRDPAGN